MSRAGRTGILLNIVHGHAGIKFDRPGHTLHKVAKHSAHDGPATVRGPGVPGQTEARIRVSEPAISLVKIPLSDNA